MDELRTYTCDYGHTWYLIRDQTDAEEASDINCKDGHEAVTLRREQFLDHATISIRPAARVVDEVTKRIDHEYEYFLLVSAMRNANWVISQKTYSWKEITTLVTEFRDLTFSKAVKKLEMLEMSESGES